MDTKFSKAQLSKISQSGGFLRNMLGDLILKKVMIDLAIPLAIDNIPGLVSNFASINKFERKISGVARAGKGFTLLIF